MFPSLIMLDSILRDMEDFLVVDTMYKIKMKKFLENWKKIPQKLSNLSEYLQAAELLERFLQRNSFQFPVNVIKKLLN